MQVKARVCQEADEGIEIEAHAEQVGQDMDKAEAEGKGKAGMTEGWDNAF